VCSRFRPPTAPPLRHRHHSRHDPFFRNPVVVVRCIREFVIMKEVISDLDLIDVDFLPVATVVAVFIKLEVTVIASFVAIARGLSVLRSTTKRVFQRTYQSR